jgi:hypothetical protein
MKNHLDSYEKWAPKLDGCAQTFLCPEELAQYNRMPAQYRQERLKDLLEEPIASFTPVNEAYFRARWAETLKMLYTGNELELLEIASGDADMIPQAMSRSHPGSTYVTANMNKALNESLLKRTQGLNIRLELVEDDAAHIKEHFGRDWFDIAAFQHGVNDVAQAILCGMAGVDTIFSDWMEILPQMIRMLQKEVKEGTLEAHVKGPFLSLMESLVEVLKPGGWVVINHYMFQLDLDWGYPPELFAGWVPLVRGWFRELAGVEEVFFDGYEPNWWIFLRKI